MTPAARWRNAAVGIAADLFRSADKRLYQAKDAGRDRAIVGGGDAAPDEVLAAAVP